MCQRFIAILILILFSVGASAQELCSHAEDASQKAREIAVATCVPVCAKVFSTDQKEAASKFENNCRRYYERRDNRSISDVVSRTYKLAMTDCFYDAAKGTAAEFYDLMKALPALVSYMLTPPSDGASSTRSQDKEWEACSRNRECKIALARNLIRFQDMNPDGSYKIDDAAVEKEISSSAFNDLLQRAQHDHGLVKEECLRTLGTLRADVARSGEEFTFEKHQEIFSKFATKSPHCPGAIGLYPPEPPTQKPEITREECIANRETPEACLQLTDKLQIGSMCGGEEFEGQALNQVCMEVTKAFFAVPIGGVQNVALKTAGKSALETIAKRSVAKVATEAAEVVTAQTAKSAAATRSASVLNFVEKYKSKIYATEAQNLKFIGTAEKSLGKGDTVFFDVENAVMKKLNDKTGDKNLVTSLTNLHKEKLLKQIEVLQKKYPEADFSVYSDFKSVKVAVSGGKDKLSPQAQALLKEDLDRAYKETNREFADQMRELGIDVKEAGPADQWFKAGSGKSVDEAAIAARRARQNSGDAKMFDYADPEVRDKMVTRLTEIEKSRQSLEASPKFSKLLDAGAKGERLPREDVFDLVRKHDSPEGLAGAISNRYKLNGFNADDARALQEYAKGVDEFSPTILVGKRETVNFDEAVYGGTSADFLGMGAANIQATAQGIRGRVNLDQALLGARQGEGKVTEVFKTRMNKFKEVVGDGVVCSGDDCVQTASRVIGEREKIRVVTQLASNPDTRKVRMAFFGPNVPREARMMLSSHGEGIEKVFRKELEGRVDFNRLEKMTFGFDMQTVQLNRGSVNLVVGKPTSVRLSVKEQQEMQAAFSRAIEKYNQGYIQGTAQTQEVRVMLLPGGGLIVGGDAEPIASPDAQEQRR